MAVQNKKRSIPGLDNIPGFVNANVSDDQLIADAAARGVYAKTDEAGNLMNREQVQERLSTPGQDIGMPAGSEKADGKIYNGLEELDGSKDRTVKNTYVKLPDGTVKPLSAVAKPEKADAISAAGALPLFVDAAATQPAMTRDAAGKNKPALLMNATLDNGNTTFQTLTADEAQITGTGGKPSEAIGSGALNVMNVYGKMAPELAQAKKAEIEETRYKDTDAKLKYNIVNTAKTSEAQAKEDARMTELNDKRMNNYYEIIAKHPEMADNESNRAYNQGVKDYNAKLDAPNDHLTTGFVPSWIDKSTLLPGENYVNGMLVNAISTPKEERMLVSAPEQLTGRTVDPIMDTDEIGGAKVPRATYGGGSGSNSPTEPGWPSITLTQTQQGGFKAQEGRNTYSYNLDNLKTLLTHASPNVKNEYKTQTNQVWAKAVGEQAIGADGSVANNMFPGATLKAKDRSATKIIGDMSSNIISFYGNDDAKNFFGGTRIEQLANATRIITGDLNDSEMQRIAQGPRDRQYPQYSTRQVAIWNAVYGAYKVPEGITPATLPQWLASEAKQARNNWLFSNKQQGVVGGDAQTRASTAQAFSHYAQSGAIAEGL